jgi:hypothetical protein
MVGKFADETVPVRLISLSYRILDVTEDAQVDGRSIACFGVTAYTGRIGVDRETGRVVCLWPTDNIPMSYVNADLAAFRESVRSAIECFPFYDSESAPDRPDVIADDLTDKLSEIDSHAFDEGSFWEAFVDDVRNGDYTAEEVVAGYGPDHRARPADRE